MSPLLTFLSNALWMAVVIAILCVAVERAKPHPLVREIAWSLGLLLAVAAPLALLWPGPASPLTGYRLTTTIEAAPASASHHWTEYAASVYAFAVAFTAARLLWRGLRLSRLTEESIATPSTFGSRILLPARFRREASPLAVEAALAHERTHLERHDFLRNIALELATLPVAFHPAVWYMKDRLAQARELVCDDLTARAFGDRRRYAQGLVEAARVLAQSSPAAPSRLAMGMLDHTDFEERIMLLNHPAPSRFRRGYLLLGAVLAIAPAMTLFGFYFQDSERVYNIGNGVAAPKLIHKVDPKYSDGAEAAKIEGSVVLGVEITRAGLADKVVVKRGLHPELDANAVESLKEWRFEPGTKDGEPVRVRATIEVNYRLK